jgi:hypothetical protein
MTKNSGASGVSKDINPPAAWFWLVGNTETRGRRDGTENFIDMPPAA